MAILCLRALNDSAAWRENNSARDAAVWLLREVLSGRVDSVAELLSGVGKSAISETFRAAVLR